MYRCPTCGESLELIYTPQHVQALFRQGKDEKAEQLMQSAPWLSPSCSRAWWPSELTREAKESWDPTTRSFKSPMVELLALTDRDERIEKAREDKKVEKDQEMGQADGIDQF